MNRSLLVRGKSLADKKCEHAKSVLGCRINKEIYKPFKTLHTSRAAYF